jgi:hypothetical protein
VPPVDPAVPGIFHLSADGALARALVQAGFQTVQQERVLLSQFARDVDEFLAVLSDMGDPFAPLLTKLTPAERDQVARAVAEGLAPYRTGDVLRIPAQTQLAWGRA